MSYKRPERIQLPPSDYGASWLLYIFRHVGKQQAVWLHKISADGEFIRGPGYTWQCSCGANDAGPGRPLTTELLHEAWSHFNAHFEAVPLHGPMARWCRGSQDLDLDSVFALEVARILGHEPELPVEVVNICGSCGETFEISNNDPHWATGRGPICPKVRPTAT